MSTTNDTAYNPNVWVWSPRLLRHTAICDCGFTGRDRILRSVAIHDALMHAAATSHMPQQLSEVYA